MEEWGRIITTITTILPSLLTKGRFFKSPGCIDSSVGFGFRVQDVGFSQGLGFRV